MCWARWLCSLTRVRRRPVILPASSCRMCCWACAVLAGRILPGRSDVRYQHVDSGMAQLQPDDGTCFQIQAFIDCSATAHYWCGVLGDLLIPLTGISCPQIMESPNPRVLGGQSPLTVSMIAPLYVVMLIGYQILGFTLL